VEQISFLLHVATHHVELLTELTIGKEEEEQSVKPDQSQRAKASALQNFRGNVNKIGSRAKLRKGIARKPGRSLYSSVT
jgi:hypothetical protein